MNFLKSGSVLAIGSAAAMLCQLFTLSLYMRKLPDDELATYLLIVAGATLISPFIRLGINNSILYYVGRNRDDAPKSMQILVTSLCYYLCILVLAFACVAFAPAALSKILFSGRQNGTLVIVALLLTSSRSMYDAFFRYLTAVRRVILPGVLQFVIMGLVPLIVILIGRPLDVKWLLVQTSIATYVVWIGFFILELISYNKAYKIRLKPDLKVLRLLLQYGIQRVPSILGFVFMLSGPVIIAEHLNLASVDIIVIGCSMSLLRMLGITNRLITLVILPRISWAQVNNPQLLLKIMWVLIAFAFFTSITLSMAFLATGDSFLRFWLHRSFLGTPGITVSLWLATIPFVIIYFLRPTIDALHFRAYNTLNVFIAIILMFAAILLENYVFKSNNPVGNAVLWSASCLSVLSLYSVWKLAKNMVIPKINIFSSRLWAVIVGSLLFVIIAIAVRYYSNTKVLNLFIAIAIMAIAALSYFAITTFLLFQPYLSIFRKKQYC